MAISNYLDKLVELKNQLATNLVEKGVVASQDEKLNTLVPKVLTIAQSGLETGDYIVKLTSDNSIPDSAFSDCSSIIRITIPNSVTSIGSTAFQNCTSLTSITIPNSVTSIGVYAFQSCTALESITIPNSVTSISSYTFTKCTSLTSIIIPNSVTSIGECAFNGCTSLSDVYYAGTEDEWNTISIDYSTPSLTSGNTYLKNATKHYNYTV